MSLIDDARQLTVKNRGPGCGVGRFIAGHPELTAPPYEIDRLFEVMRNGDVTASAAHEALTSAGFDVPFSSQTLRRHAIRKCLCGSR